MDLPKEIVDFVVAVAEFAETLPERYRVSAFEYILKSTRVAGLTRETLEDKSTILDGNEIRPNRKMIPFLRRFNISAGTLSQLFILDGGEMIPVYTYAPDKYSTTDTFANYGCLLALENAIRDGLFKFKKDHLRNLLQEKGLYDSGTFMQYLGRRSEYFTDLSSEEIYLSDQGKRRLADLVKMLTSTGDE